MNFTLQYVFVNQLKDNRRIMMSAPGDEETHGIIQKYPGTSDSDRTMPVRDACWAGNYVSALFSFEELHLIDTY
jgi:hypothetical protein